MNLISDERGKTWDAVDVETKSLTTDRLQHVVKRGLFDETQLDGADVWKVCHELELDSDGQAASLGLVR